METRDKYQPVIGLEVHMQLLTKSKAFSPDEASYGAPPNTNISVISMGHPGTLPKLNERVVEFAVRLGLATGSEINKENHFSRKNYFYADLPKGYQITQFDTPICTKGHITIEVDGQEKQIGLTRIHIEEDAGKSMHEIDPYHSLIDLNRAGVALLEMVSEPDLRSPEEAYAYLSEVRQLVQYLGICDGNMEEGSLRCDANVSVMLKGAEKFGEKVEVKNMNSIRNVKRALEHEIARQVTLIEQGATVHQDTRSFDDFSGTTFSMRSKEQAHDYRYFTEPDLPPIFITMDYIAGIKSRIPPLPRELRLKYVSSLGLSEYDAQVLTGQKEIALFFEELISHTDNYKSAANWVMGPIKSYLNDMAIPWDELPIKAATIAGLIKIVDEGKVSFSVASQKIFPHLLENPEKTPSIVAEEMNLVQESGEDTLMGFIQEAIKKYPDKVEAYKAGKKGLIGLFMGEVMKLSKGKADPKKANQLLSKTLDKP